MKRIFFLLLLLNFLCVPTTVFLWQAPGRPEIDIKSILILVLLGVVLISIRYILFLRKKFADNKSENRRRRKQRSPVATTPVQVVYSQPPTTMPMPETPTRGNVVPPDSVEDRFI